MWFTETHMQNKQVGFLNFWLTSDSLSRHFCFQHIRPPEIYYWCEKQPVKNSFLFIVRYDLSVTQSLISLSLFTVGKIYVVLGSSVSKSITVSLFIWWKKKHLIGRFVGNWCSWRTREEHCFLSPKCFHSLNKFNKTSFDWQESALPQCLLFALTFLVSSCAPFWMRWRLQICAVHTHYRLGTSRTFIQGLRWPECATHETFQKCYFVSLRVL